MTLGCCRCCTHPLDLLPARKTRSVCDLLIGRRCSFADVHATAPNACSHYRLLNRKAKMQFSYNSMISCMYMQRE